MAAHSISGAMVGVIWYLKYGLAHLREPADVRRKWDIPGGLTVGRRRNTYISDHSLPETIDLEMSKRLDTAMRRVKEMPPSFQERAIIRLQALIREWEMGPNQQAQETLRQRLRRKLLSAGRVLKLA